MRLDRGERERGKNIPGRGISKNPKAGTSPMYQRRVKSAWLEQSEPGKNRSRGNGGTPDYTRTCEVM